MLFITTKGTLWEIPTHTTCHSKIVIYYQTCKFCEQTTNNGKTNNLRLRMNNHISACRLGNSTDLFDNHVYRCNEQKNPCWFTRNTYKGMSMIQSIDRLNK